MCEKRCVVCGNPVPTPRHTYCAECRAERTAEQKRVYLRSDKRKKRRQELAALPENREKNRLKAREYYYTHRDEIREKARQYAKEHPEEHRTRCREWKRKNAVHTCYRCHMPWDKQGRGRICPTCLELEAKEKMRKNRKLSPDKTQKPSLKAKMDMIRDILARRKAA